MSKATSLGLRLFLEGIEVPCIAAQVHLQPNTPATATVQIVPTNAALSFLPRTLVHLFYLDDQATSTDAEKKKTTIQRPSINRIDVPDERYKLLFTGEVIGYNFQKTPINRAMILQCMDLSSYWDTCYQWFEDWSVSGNALTDRSYAFVGGGVGLFDNVAGDPKSVIADILKSAPKNPAYRKTRGLLGGMISLLETIGGIRPDKGDFGGYRGVNDFFSIAELRYRLTAQIGALESDKTAAQIYSSKAFISWLKKGISSLGTLISFRQIIGHVSRYVFHDIYPNPAAYYIPSEVEEVWYKTTRRTKIQEEDTTTRDKLKKVLIQLQSARKRIETGVAGGAGTATTGRNRVSVDSIEPTLGKVVIVERTKTKVVGDDVALSALAAYPKFLNEARKLIGEVVATPGMDAATKSRLETAYLQLEDAYLKSDSPSWGGRGKTNVNVQKIVANASVIDERIARAYQIIMNLLKVKALKEIVKDNTPGSYKRRIERGGHLFTQLILPETFFLPPPRCNVLFPDQYTQFTFSRNFMQEVTRLSCSGGLGVLISGDANSRRILGSHYFAPNIKAHSGGSLVGNYWRGGKVILPHEIHSGIIPKMEFVQGGHRWGAKAAKEKGVKNVPYIQRLANFQFFMHRWAARTISVTASFNPRLVLGMSALVIDQSAPAPAALKEIEKALNRSVLPTQYLGKIASLSHDVNQSGGQTQVMMSHCRTHRGLDDEFVGILDRNVYDASKTSIVVKEMKNTSENTEKKSDKKTKLFREIVKGTRLKSVKATVETNPAAFTGSGTDIFSGGGSLVVPEYTKEFTADKALRKYVKGYGTITKIEFQGVQLLTLDTLSKMGLVQGDIDATLVKDVNIGQYSLTYYFPEKITVTYSHQTGDTVRSQRPIEELIMPGWYDSSWHTKNIGEGNPDAGKPGAYLSLLGCGAITDDAESAEFTQASLYYGDLQYSGPAIEKSVDGLSILYGVIKDAGHDVHEFIRNYTDRPIANLVEILGSSDYDPDAGTGTEGFHSNAFGDYNAGVVFNTGSPPTPDPDTGKRRPQAHLVPAGASIPTKSWRKKRLPEIPKYLDPRGRARLRVKAYMEELSLSRGLKG